MGARIFITGSCSSAFGNWEQQLGNAAILIGLLETIHKHLPEASIQTKYQLSHKFCEQYKIRSILLEQETGTKIRKALATLRDFLLSAAWRFFLGVLRLDIPLLRSTRLLKSYYDSDLIIDLSGDTFGDNIPFKNFVKHAMDLTTARLLKKPIVSLANSPGPFTGSLKKNIARFVFNRVSLITTREPISAALLQSLGITTPVITTACPAFLLKPAPDDRVRQIMQSEGVNESVKPLVGFTLSGYNLYSKPTWDIPETLEDIKIYIPTLKFILSELNAQVLLIPHVYRTNPWTGQHIQGPDYVILENLKRAVEKYESTGRLKLIQGTYSPAEVKGLIGKLDLHISGRLHAGVAALSQYVPTVLLAYGHKHLGFAKMVGTERYVWQPSMGPKGLLSIVREIWEEKENVTNELKKRIPVIKKLAELNVKILREMISLDESQRYPIPRYIVNKWRASSWESIIANLNEGQEQ